jgi:hypothetical protein
MNRRPNRPAIISSGPRASIDLKARCRDLGLQPTSIHIIAIDRIPAA